MTKILDYNVLKRLMKYKYTSIGLFLTFFGLSLAWGFYPNGGSTSPILQHIIIDAITLSGISFGLYSILVKEKSNYFGVSDWRTRK